MSMSYSDCFEFNAVSDCCGAGVYLNGICAECNDHCTPVHDTDELIKNKEWIFAIDEEEK